MVGFVAARLVLIAVEQQFVADKKHVGWLGNCGPSVTACCFQFPRCRRRNG